MKTIKMTVLFVLLLLTCNIGSQSSHAATASLPIPSHCSDQEIEPDNTMASATLICNTDDQDFYAYFSPGDIDYLVDTIPYDSTSLTITAINNGKEPVNFTVLDSAGKPLQGTYAKTNVSYITTYSDIGLAKGAYYIKVTNAASMYNIKIVHKQVLNGWIEKGSNWYFYKDNQMYTGTRWVNYKNQWFYMINSIRQQNGWLFTGNRWYYMQPNTGVRQTGWIQINKDKYYLDPKNGDMKTGWIQLNKQWYYFNLKNGIMQTGLVAIDNKWHYFDPATGVLKVGWVTVNKKRVYSNPR